MTRGAGRFAPSPTGPLHHGSLLAATASFLDSRTRNVSWFVRIDDLDTPRVAPGAEAAILDSLEAHGLHPDGPVIRQSDRIPRYQAALEQLSRQGCLFYCTCSRQMLVDEPVYPGTCRAQRDPRPEASIRIRVDDTPIRFRDLIHGDCEEVLSRTCGDFVVRRRDGLMAYQLATAVDDGEEGITRVIRGGDLLENTARQIYLMRRLGLSEPAYAHLPVLVDDQGQKLSKQSHAPPLDDARPTDNLLAILPSLALAPPAAAGRWSAEALLHWATDHFDLRRIQGGTVSFRL